MNTAAKTSFTHTTSTGNVATRKSAAEYTHVTVGTSRFAPKGVEVLAWHKTQAAADKYAKQYADPRASYINVKVEAINGGEA